MRGGLSYRGFPQALIGGVTNLFVNTYDTVEIRSALTPPMVFNTQDLLDQTPGPVNPLISMLKPTIILNGAGGRQVIAPGGEAGGEGGTSGGLLGLAFVGGLVGIGYLLGRRSRR